MFTILIRLTVHGWNSDLSVVKKSLFGLLIVNTPDVVVQEIYTGRGKSSDYEESLKFSLQSLLGYMCRFGESRNELQHLNTYSLSTAFSPTLVM